MTWVSAQGGTDWEGAAKKKKKKLPIVDRRSFPFHICIKCYFVPFFAHHRAEDYFIKFFFLKQFRLPLITSASEVDIFRLVRIHNREYVKYKLRFFLMFLLN